MKTLISLSFSCFVSLFYLACSKSDAIDSSYELGETFELAFEATAEIDDAEIHISFVDMLEDSRCPETGICFWEGQVKVALNIEMEGNLQTIELIDRVGHPLKAQTTLGEKTIRLVSVEPAKLTVDEISKDKYVIMLIIE